MQFSTTSFEQNRKLKFKTTWLNSKKSHQNTEVKRGRFVQDFYTSASHPTLFSQIIQFRKKHRLRKKVF